MVFTNLEWVEKGASEALAGSSQGQTSGTIGTFGTKRLIHNRTSRCGLIVLVFQQKCVKLAEQALLLIRPEKSGLNGISNQARDIIAV